MVLYSMFLKMQGHTKLQEPHIGIYLSNRPSTFYGVIKVGYREGEYGISPFFPILLDEVAALKT